jgi:hypothetical protein
MNHEILSVLNSTADDFGKIAKKVNESSRKRKNYSEEAINYINMCLDIEETMDKDFSSVFDTNIEQRNKDSVVYNSCKILRTNVESQKQVLQEIQKKNIIGKEISEQLLAKNKEFLHTLEEAVSNVQRIIEKDNQIILLDKQIRKRKQLQKESLEKLNQLANTSLKDAEKAIEGSSANLERGLQMVNRLKNIETLVIENNKDELNRLADEANKGWNTATNVNKSSTSQFEFAEKVNKYTNQLFEDATAIKDLVVQKHHEFEENLQLVTVLTVILSIKFKKYLSIEEICDKIEMAEKGRDLIESLMIQINIACNDIREISALNFDMTDMSNLNNVIEDRTVHSTEEELEHFDSIKKEVELMTEATRYPVEGSSKNIANGQTIEKYIREAIASLK